MENIGPNTLRTRLDENLPEKNLLNSNISSICFQNMVNVSPLTGFATWLRYCTDVAQWRSTKLCTMFGRLQGWYTMYINLRGTCPLPEYCQVQNSLCVLFTVTARHWSSGRQPNFAAWYNEWNHRTFTVGTTYTAGRPSLWTLTHIASSVMIFGFIFIYSYYGRPA